MNSSVVRPVTLADRYWLADEYDYIQNECMEAEMQFARDAMEDAPVSARVAELMTEARALAVSITVIDRMPNDDIRRSHLSTFYASRTALLHLAGQIIAAGVQEGWESCPAWARELSELLSSTGILRVAP